MKSVQNDSTQEPTKADLLLTEKNIMNFLLDYGKKNKENISGGVAKMKRSLANCKITPKTGPNGHTQNGCHMDALCIGQTGLSVSERKENWP